VSLTAVFLTAFLAATILPLSSEAALAGAVWLEPARLWWLLAAATAGNTLGAVVNWAIGRYLAVLGSRRLPRLGIDPVRLAAAERRFRRFGTPVLLFAWLPVVGDPLTVAAGLFRVPLCAFVPLVALGKGARYAAIAGAVPWLAG